MPAPPEGITVLDFTRYQNGPHATVMLSDMGARVIKVERPHERDPGRWLGRQEARTSARSRTLCSTRPSRCRRARLEAMRTLPCTR